MPVQQRIMADPAVLSPGFENTTSKADPGSPPSGSGRQHRQRLKPWLIDQINSGQCLGVSWVDEQKGIFRIPWKHCGRSDWTEQDGHLYMAWAIHTGRFTEGGADKPDWPTWKTRLRCALNKMKPDIVCLKEESTTDDVDDPYRVYQFVRKRGVGPASPPQQQYAHTPQSAYSEDSSTCGSPSPFCLSPHPPNRLQANIPSVVIETPVTDGAAAPVQDQVYDDPVVSSLGSSLGQLKTEDLVKDNIDDISQYLTGGNYMESNMMSLTSPPQSMETDSLKDSLKDAGYHQLAELVKSEPEQQVKTEPGCAQQYIYPHEMMLMIRYRRSLIAQLQVLKPQGCRVYHGDSIPSQFWVKELFGDLQAEQVSIPDVTGQMEQSHKDSLDYLKLLKALQFGISIFIHQNDIYILRRCQASIFTAPANKKVKETLKVERNAQPVKVFDFVNDFLPALHLYKQGQGPRPSPLVVIAIGQPFRPDDDPYGSLLLSVTVCHSLASLMLQENVPESPPLQISHSNEYDRFAESVTVSQANLSPYGATVSPANQQ
ncbi:interferon regulatory factor 4-like isoform X2 [Littorina saxatilis]|uniref:interferon regulatory factor 4-like isoform X2 n=1 Tax=Littorina saxatilis TaxID=31220 RepID=UPI0038B4A1F2